MALLGQIRPVWFIGALAFGILYCYLVSPKPEVVVRFPSPYNAGKVTYTAKGGDTCFTFNASKVACPLDRKLIKEQPIMEDFGGRSGGARGG